MKHIHTIIPGLIDVALEDLGGKTPFQKASTPTIDAIAEQGETILHSPPSTGGFETALLALLGAQNNLENTYQGPLEAYAMGYALSPRQIAYSVRFVSAGEGIITDVTDDLLNDAECKQFCRILNDVFGVKGLHFIPLKGPRAVLITDNSSLTDLESYRGLNPIDTIGFHWTTLVPEGEGKAETISLLHQANDLLTAAELNDLRLDLEEPPINALLLSEGGKAHRWSIDSSIKKVLFTTSMVSKGVGKSLEIDVWELAPEKCRFDHVPCLLDAIPKVIENADTLFIELPYVWESTYKGDLLGKIKTIEWLDTHWFAPLERLCRSNKWKMTLDPLRKCDIRTGSFSSDPVSSISMG